MEVLEHGILLNGRVAKLLVATVFFNLKLVDFTSKKSLQKTELLLFPGVAKSANWPPQCGRIH